MCVWGLIQSLNVIIVVVVSFLNHSKAMLSDVIFLLVNTLRYNLVASQLVYCISENHKFP